MDSEILVFGTLGGLRDLGAFFYLNVLINIEDHRTPSQFSKNDSIINKKRIQQIATMARWYLGRQPLIIHRNWILQGSQSPVSAGKIRYVHRIGQNKQKKTLILYANGTKRPPSALVSSAENTVHTHTASKRDPHSVQQRGS